MEAPSQGQFSQEDLALGSEKEKLTKKIKLYSTAITVGTSMIVVSVIMLAYYVFTSWHSENYKSVGFLLTVFGGLLTGSSSRKKKSAQLELIAIEQRLAQANRM